MLKSNRCYDKGNYIEFAATRLTADSWSGIINDYYHRPLPERPYYYIHNVNTSTTIPTNPVEIRYDGLGRSIGLKNCGTDMINKDYEVPPEGESIIKPITKANINDQIPGEVAPSEYPNFPRAIRVDDRYTISTVEKATAQRYGNASKVRCEIRYGRDSSVYQLEKVFIDYIKTPQTIRLTKEQMDLTEDTSQIMEFPDYVCQEIINELVILIMQRDADPRLQTQTIVTQSIANPAQQQTPQPQPQQRGN